MSTFMGFPQSGHSFTADEVGQALAGLIARDSNGMPKTGMLGSQPSVTAVNGAWKVAVGRFVYVHSVLGAVQLSGVSESEQLDIVPAVGDIPNGQSRIDRVCWKPEDAELVVLKGIPGSDPVAPSAGAFARVALVRVASADGAVIAGQITVDAAVTSLAGGGSETRTLNAPLAGASAWNGVLSWQSIAPVTFQQPFAAAPALQVTAEHKSEAVQVFQLTGVTATGFTGRVLRFGHATPLVPKITYTAAVV